jgi:hypothetical protein
MRSRIAIPSPSFTDIEAAILSAMYEVLPKSTLLI